MNHRIFPAADYRDPALILEDAQAKTCIGCAWIAQVDSWRAGQAEPEIREFCAKQEKFGRRCEHYTERKWHG